MIESQCEALLPDLNRLGRAIRELRAFLNDGDNNGLYCSYHVQDELLRVISLYEQAHYELHQLVCDTVLGGNFVLFEHGDA